MGFKFNPFTGTLDLVNEGGGATTAPGGSDKQLQFNDAGSFGGASNTYWDKAYGLLGIYQATPTVPLHIGAVNSSIAPPSAASTSITRVYDLPTPTASATQITGPDDASGVVFSGFDYSMGGIWQADGSHWEILIFGVVTINGIYYSSAASAYADLGYDDNSSSFFTIPLSWTTPTIYDNQIIEVRRNGNTDSYWAVGTLSSVNLDGTQSTASGPTPFSSIAFPYDSGGTSPSPYNSLSQSVVDVGSGSLYADNTYYIFEVDSATQINGVWYTSGSPISSSGYDFNDGQYFNWNLSWYNYGGSETDSIIRVSTDSGSTWKYFFAGSVTGQTYSTQSDDSTASAAWGRTYAGPVGLTRNYRAYSVAGATYGAYYDPTGYYYNFTDNNPPTGYVVQHSLSSVSPATSIKVLGSNSGSGFTNSYTSYSLTGSFVETNTGFWAGDPTITPSHGGLLGNGQTYNFRLYSYRVSPSLLYSSTYTSLTRTLPNDGAYYYITLGWTNAPAIYNIKILRDTGSGFVTGHVAGGISLIYDNQGPNWSSGTTVSPSVIASSSAIFESSNQSITGNGQLVMKGIATGPGATPVAKLDFQNSTSSLGYISSIPAGAGMAGMRFNSADGLFEFHNNSQGVVASFYGSTFQFNKSQSGGSTFTFFGPIGVNPPLHIENVSGYFTTFIGYETGSVGYGSGSRLAVGYPSNSTTASFLIRSYSNDSSRWALQVRDDAGTSYFKIRSDGQTTISSNTPGNALLNVGAPANYYGEGNISIQPKTALAIYSLANVLENYSNELYWSDSSFVRTILIRTASGSPLVNNTIPIANSLGRLTNSPISIGGGNILNVNPSGGTLFQSAMSTNATSTATFNGGTAVATGTNTGTTSKVGGVLYTTYNDVGNATTTETDLFNYSIPANALAANGQGIRAVYCGTYSTQAVTKRIRVYLDTTLIYDSTAVNTSTSTATHWAINVNVIRASTTSARVVVQFMSDNATVIDPVTYTAVTVANWTAARVLKVTGTATNNNDIVAKLSRIEWTPT